MVEDSFHKQLHGYFVVSLEEKQVLINNKGVE